MTLNVKISQFYLYLYVNYEHSKCVGYIFLGTLCIIINKRKKIRVGGINSVSYAGLKHICLVMRYGRDQVAVNVLT
jgi:hypothetical protein